MLHIFSGTVYCTQAFMSSSLHNIYCYVLLLLLDTAHYAILIPKICTVSTLYLIIVWQHNINTAIDRDTSMYTFYHLHTSTCNIFCIVDEVWSSLKMITTCGGNLLEQWINTVQQTGHEGFSASKLFLYDFRLPPRSR